MEEYTFEDWKEGIPPKPHYFNYFDETDDPDKYEVKLHIIRAQKQGFDFLVNYKANMAKWEIQSILDDLQHLSDKKSFLGQKAKEYSKSLNKIGRIKVLLGPSEKDIDFIGGDLYRYMFYDMHELPIANYFDLVWGNDFFQATVANHVLNYIKDLLNELDNPACEENEIVSEQLKNLSHKLCICYELGILDIFDEYFKHKNNNSRRIVTDKARLLASVLDEKDPEKVRLALKNKDFLSGIAVSRAIDTLRDHGITHKKLIKPNDI